MDITLSFNAFPLWMQSTFAVLFLLAVAVHSFASLARLLQETFSRRSRPLRRRRSQKKQKVRSTSTAIVQPKSSTPLSN